MGREERYTWITAAGAATGFGWWSTLQAATSGCDGQEPFCDLGWILLLPLVPLLSWLLPWFALHLLHVEKPGVTAGLGAGVFTLLGWILLVAGTADLSVPLPLWLTMTLVGALSFLVAARHTA